MVWAHDATYHMLQSVFGNADDGGSRVIGCVVDVGQLQANQAHVRREIDSRAGLPAVWLFFGPKGEVV